MNIALEEPFVKWKHAELLLLERDKIVLCFSGYLNSSEDNLNTLLCVVIIIRNDLE